MFKNSNKEELLLKCLQGKADDNEYEIAYNWINSDPANLDYYKQIRDAWIASENYHQQKSI
jgi:hypothetical protein